jgi:hypothetical protein
MRVKQIAGPNQTKVCPMCNRDLPLEAYSKGTGMYGRRSICMSEKGRISLISLLN